MDFGGEREVMWNRVVIVMNRWAMNRDELRR